MLNVSGHTTPVSGEIRLAQAVVRPGIAVHTNAVPTGTVVLTARLSNDLVVVANLVVSVLLAIIVAIIIGG